MSKHFGALLSLVFATCTSTSMLTACATVSDVIPIGKDTYMVGSSVRGGLTSDTEVKALSLKRANEFCASKGKTMVVSTAHSSGVQGWTPQNSEITFLCVDENDPDNTRVRLRKEPDTAIELRK